MEITNEIYQTIEHLFPKQKSAPKISNLDILNTLLHVLENGCKWRSLGKDWHTIYMRVNRWAKNGVLEKIFIYLQKNGTISFKSRIFCLDSTCVKVHRGARSIKKNGKQAIGKTKGGWNTKVHMICADDRNPVIFTLLPGQNGDAPEGRALLEKLGKIKKKKYLLMDKAYEGYETRNLAETLNFIPVVPPKSNRKVPWLFDKILYKKRNKVKRIFRRLDRFRRIFTRYDKLDWMFISFLYLAFIFDSLFRVNRL